jgi:hypothetical protein
MAERCEEITNRLVFELQSKFERIGSGAWSDRSARALVLPGVQYTMPVSREECYKKLAMEDGSLDADRRFLAEVCAYCGEMHRVLDEEWVAYATFVQMVLSQQEK